ncbi:repeat domain-containing protein 55 [Seminavis robusta]|uniref:Repeat domain-containing protein 55 n=1 Tax=Seminavis robusta TaxID=568900 RepID=A0A9N8D6U7_9STRA|nr:repeat domain-containing protein 55 [Seminavis robusta]|eukprot:Sro20_g014410.1 repeat domain-containing protein 55 (574) ;mRNA; f:162326-164047
MSRDHKSNKKSKAALIHEAVEKFETLEKFVATFQDTIVTGGDDDEIFSALGDGVIFAALLESRDQGETLLLHACRRQLWEIAEWLLHHGAQVNVVVQQEEAPQHGTRHLSRETPLHYACKFNSGDRPWRYESRIGSLEVVRLLLENGANVHAEDAYGSTPVHLAAASGDARVLGLLLDHGGDILVGKDHPRTRPPFNLITSVEALDLVLERRPKLLEHTDQHGNGCIYWARNHQVLRRLLDRGANPNQANEHGYTPLHSGCASWRHDDDIQLLLEGGADINARTTEKLLTPLHVVCKGQNIVTAELFILHGADLSAKDYQGNTPLHLLCQTKGHEAYVGRLLRKGAPVNMQNNKGETPLHIACGYKVDERLVRAGLLAMQRFYTINRPRRHPPPSLASRLYRSLFTSAGGNNRNDDEAEVPEQDIYLVALVECLLRHCAGASVQMADVNGSTPLHIACRKGSRSLVRLLLKEGADPTARDSEGNTPVHAACFEGHWSLLPLLVDDGDDDEVNALSMKNHNEQLPSHAIFLHDNAPLDLLFHAVKDCSSGLHSWVGTIVAESRCKSVVGFMSLW